MTILTTVAPWASHRGMAILTTTAPALYPTRSVHGHDTAHPLSVHEHDYSDYNRSLRSVCRHDYSDNDSSALGHGYSDCNSPRALYASMTILHATDPLALMQA
jgi:hypothetical protein